MSGKIHSIMDIQNTFTDIQKKTIVDIWKSDRITVNSVCQLPYGNLSKSWLWISGHRTIYKRQLAWVLHSTDNWTYRLHFSRESGADHFVNGLADRQQIEVCAIRKPVLLG